MSIPGYIDYQRREYCKDIQCPIQCQMDTKEKGAAEYEELRDVCRNDCKHTTYEFHHWLIEQGYFVVRKEN